MRIHWARRLVARRTRDPRDRNYLRGMFQSFARDVAFGLVGRLFDFAVARISGSETVVKNLGGYGDSRAGFLRTVSDREIRASAKSNSWCATTKGNTREKDRNNTRRISGS